jgi:hypothetical protein
MFPLQFNDGSDVPDEWLSDALDEIVQQFGGASYQAQPIEGHWIHDEVHYQDKLVKLVVDVADSARNRRWMANYKVRWRAKLEQLELWMVSYRINVE